MKTLTASLACVSLFILSCVSAQERERIAAVEKAAKLPIKNYCPLYGNLTDDSYYWPVWHNREDNQWFIELKSKGGDVISLPFKEATEDKKISTKPAMETYLANFRFLCESEKPPFYYDIDFVQQETARQLNNQIEERKQKYSRMYVIKNGNDDFNKALWDGRFYTGFDNTIIERDEFSYQENRKKYEDIRSHKYFVLPASDFRVEFSEYDFSKGGFFISFKKEDDIGSFRGRGGYSYILYESNRFFLPFPEENAKQLRADQTAMAALLRQMYLIVAIEKEPVIKKNIFECDLYFGTMAIAPESYMADKYEYDSKCTTVKPKTDSLRTIEFRIVEIFSLHV